MDLLSSSATLQDNKEVAMPGEPNWLAQGSKAKPCWHRN
jgi:hypothetical protein